jgi:homoserine kinase type II
MAVFTEVSKKEARELLRRLQLGELVALRGIEGGIENTNYFLTSDAGRVRAHAVRAPDAEQLPFYLHLMKHLAHHGIPVPDPGPTRTATSCTPCAASPPPW